MLASFTKPTLVAVVAPHCAECRAIAPDLDAAAEVHSEVDLVMLDASQHTETAAELRVRGTPTLIAVREGREVARFIGRRTRSELDDLFAALPSGDLDAVPRVGRGDKLVWAVAGLAVSIAGLAMGPNWLLVATGAALAGYASIR